MKTAHEIRQEFIDFFLQRNHQFIPSSSVVPMEDPTLLFTNAGMNQFKNIFLGTQTPKHSRAANSQKCIRVSGKHNDLEEVGRDTYHHTFFEMLGNWSFGDYFKAEAIEWAWQLLTETWKLPKDRLWATVFGGDTADHLSPDTEAEKLWPEKTDIAPEHVLRFGRKDNFWEMGDVGPCGPCSEIHYDLGPEHCDRKHLPNHICQVNGECGRYIELWNLVFIQYHRDETGDLHNLPAQHVDTGAGLERIVAVMQNKPSNYDTDLFMPIINQLAQLSGKTYSSKLDNDTDNAFRVISDHLRTLTFAITDGAMPGNDGRGYVLRRLLRRAARYGLFLDQHQPFIHKLVPTLIDEMGHAFPELNDRAEHVINVIHAEEESFCRTLDRGIEIFENDVTQMKKNNQTELPGDKAFRLYDTYGFPLDLTELMAQEKGLSVQTAEFDRLMDQQRQRARNAQKNVSYQADELSEQLPETGDADKYHTTTLNARLIGYILPEEKLYKTEGAVPTNRPVGLVFDRTCAYAEAGGQIGDKGKVLSTPDSRQLFPFDDTQRIGRAVIHLGQTQTENIQVGCEVSIQIDPAREDIRCNHTATHLLQWAIQQVLGPHARQEGSLVCADHLRFDFTHPKALTKQEIENIEHLVRSQITAAAPVTFKVMPADDARKLGAMALFSEKYGDHVRVLGIGTGSPDRLEEAFSREFCGGTHVTNTRDIGGFKIIREESVATGVRRITAMTGRGLNEFLYLRSDQIDQIAELLKTTPDQLIQRTDSILDQNKTLKKQLRKSETSDLKSIGQKLLDESQKIGDATVIIGQIPEAAVEAVRGQIDWLRQKAGSAAILLGMPASDGKAMLFAAVTDDLIARGLKAGQIVKEIAPIIGGGGGGRPQMAQAGGKKQDQLPHALKKAHEYIRDTLT